jgi:GLPGLI family protein
MKTIVKKSATIAGFMLLFLTTVFAGKPFEGTITYKITYPENKFSESQMAMFPKLMSISVKGSKSRSEMMMSAITSVEIKDHVEKTSTTLINVMGQKFAIKQNQAEIEKEWANAGIPTIEYSAETKMIAGYKCKKAVVTMNNDGVKSTFEAFYTNELGGSNVNFDNPVYNGIDGVLLEFTISMMEMNAKFTASSVEKKGLPAKDFEVPSDYKPTTKDELKSLFGGGNE